MVPKIPSQIENFHDSLSSGTNRKLSEDFLAMNNKKNAVTANAYLSHAEVAGSMDAGLSSPKP
tara:strand:+ start:2070 stop:2258 length:189 start_codon:yes stop_codon:yes gene_type:complete